MPFYSGSFWAKAAVASAAVAASTFLSASMASAQQVDLELFLSLDNSGSIDANEYSLQREGYARAFESAAIQAAIASKPNGVAVALGQWATTAQNPPIIPWTLLTNAAQSNAFATTIRGITRAPGNLTCIACGINAAVASIEGNTFFGGGKVIDVSGDGRQNQSATNGPTTVTGARDAAAALGIRINGLAILDGDPSLLGYFQTNVITSDGFAVAASNFADFDRAVALKIEREITGGGDAVPGPLPILGAGMAFGFSRRLRKRINLATLA